MEVVGHDGTKDLWGVQDDHIVEQETDREDIGIRGFDYNLFD